MENFGTKNNIENPIWNKIKNYTQVVTLSAFLALVGKQGFAQEENKLINLDSLKKESAISEGDILNNVMNNGENYIVEFNDFKIDTKRLTINNNIVEVAYNKEGKPTWMFTQTEDGSTAFFDNNVDGKIDRIILNDTKGKTPEGKQTNNASHSIIPIKVLAEFAKASSRFESGDESEIISVNEKERKIEIVSYKSGKLFEIEGEGFDRFLIKMQGFFNYTLKTIDTKK